MRRLYRISFRSCCSLLVLSLLASCGKNDHPRPNWTDRPELDPFGFIVAVQPVGGNSLQTNIVRLDRRLGALTTLVARVGHSAISPVVTPDGRTLVFSASFEKETPLPSDPPGGALFRMDLAGGEYARVTSDDWMWVQEYQPEVSPDGMTLVYVRVDQAIGPLQSLGRLWLVNLDGTDGRPVFSDQTPRNDYSPAFSRDGRKLVYLSDNGRAAVADVMYLDLDGGEPPLNLTGFQWGDVQGVWDPFLDASAEWAYVFMGSYTGTSSPYGLYRVPTTGGTPELVVEVPAVDMPQHGVLQAPAYRDFRPTASRRRFVLVAAQDDAYQLHTTPALTNPLSTVPASAPGTDLLEPFWWRP